MKLSSLKRIEEPLPKHVRELRRIAGWTQVDVAKLLGVHFTYAHGSVTVRRWETDTLNDSFRKIPMPCWRLLLVLAGGLKVQDLLDELSW